MLSCNNAYWSQLFACALSRVRRPVQGPGAVRDSAAGVVSPSTGATMLRHMCGGQKFRGDPDRTESIFYQRFSDVEINVHTHQMNDKSEQLQKIRLHV